MDFLQLAEQRYTTKKYDPTKKIPEDRIQDLKEILRLSPSSINSQPWQFIFVSDEALKRKLAEQSFFNDQKVKDASHLVVFTVINDLKKFEEQIERHLQPGSVGYYKQFLKPLDEDVIQSWLSHQVYLSLGFFLGACASMGIDSTPMEGIEKEGYDSVLQLDGYTSLFAVAIGYRDSEDPNQPALKQKSRLDLDAVVQSI
ncbi:nitroreductase family protein [Flagellimonas sediminis]|uniref:NAD(P)H-dependent oxidoreductase n=1 Tax=Flagellimonas sediminis TaxID=2696468 RepID=A0A6I5KWC7_9FLAO|nr:nitroreductase family protein [Allomuricauda sediminis]NDV45097.1 NAD(P)H-dependent oxidoreductase [Allomuricauda sediminis]